MALNYIWIAFFLIAFVVGLIKLIFFGDTEVFGKMVNSTFDMAKVGFEISIGLTGVLALWLGLMKIGENGGMVRILARIVGPFFNKLFPEVPKDHPANGAILMNFSANLLGLDNAATPMGLKAMKELQSLNPEKEVASNAQIMFLVLNTSGLTLIPITVMLYRAKYGALNPSDVFIPILLATFCSTLAGLLITSFYQKLNLFQPVILAYLGGMILLIAGMLWYFSCLSKEDLQVQSALLGNIILFTIMISFIALAAYKKVNVYESFIEGAKEGFQVAITIIPFLVGILVAIGVFRASGTMDFIVLGIEKIVAFIGLNTDFVGSLPTALMKPLSGSGARGMMLDTFNPKVYGVDSFQGKLAATMQGSTDTTFYVLALYFGSVGIRNTRHAVICGLFADLIGIIAAIFIAYKFF